MQEDTIIHKSKPPLDGEITNEELTKQLVAIYKVRGPRRIFEWTITIVLIGCVVWPVIFGKPLTSTGAVQLAEIGLHPRHLAVFMGFMGCLRLAILVYHGQLGGYCPWIRAGIAVICAFIWVQFLMANAIAAADRPETSIGIPLYFGLVVGELICCVRAVIDARYPVHI